MATGQIISIKEIGTVFILLADSRGIKLYNIVLPSNNHSNLILFKEP